MRKLKKGDPVIVISWKHKWAKSTIVKVDGDRVYLHDVNKVKKALNPKKNNGKSGFVEIEAPIHISNVAYLEDGKPTKIAIKIDEKTNKKVRVSKRTGKVLPENARNS